MTKAMCVLLFLCMALPSMGFQGAKAKITMKVVDESGDVVSNAFVSAGFWSPLVPPGTGRFVEGLTDTNGVFIIEGTAYTDMGYTITNARFYMTDGHINFTNRVIASRTGKWESYGQTNVAILKRIRNPIPMYVKRVAAMVPILGQDVGYDLLVGDWVHPNGKGCVSDLVFNVTGQYRDPWNRKMKYSLTFSNEKDGIQLFTNRIDENGNPKGSEFRSDHMAPESGYEKQRTYEMMCRQAQVGPSGSIEGTNIVPQREQPNANFYYRVRTMTNETGQITNALYGKVYRHILADFAGDSDKTKYLEVYFTFYLNPTPNDRNLEFDPKRNLFKNSDSLEAVTVP